MIYQQLVFKTCMSDVARLLGWQLHAQWLYHRISFVWRSQYTICSTNLVFRTFQKFWQLIRNLFVSDNFSDRHMRARGEQIKSRKRFQNWNFRHFSSFSSACSSCTGAITWWYFSPMFTRCESWSYKFWLHELVHCPQTVMLFLLAHYLFFWFEL